jgi:hypothetical protein
MMPSKGQNLEVSESFDIYLKPNILLISGGFTNTLYIHLNKIWVGHLSLFNLIGLPDSNQEVLELNFHMSKIQKNIQIDIKWIKTLLG